MVCPLPHTTRLHYVAHPQLLEIHELPETFDFSNAKDSPYIVEAKGQRVFWKDCWFKIYPKGQPKPIEEHKTCSGWALLTGDIEVQFSEGGGKIKETS